MRRVLLVALIVAMAAPAALAVVNGRPDSGFIRTATNVNWHNGTSFVAPPVSQSIPNGLTRDGAAEGFQFTAAGAQLELQFALPTSHAVDVPPNPVTPRTGQIGYSSSGGSDVNLALYFGVSGGVAAVVSGTILIQDIAYSTDGSTFGAQLSLGIFVPALGLSAPQPETAYYTNVSNAPSTAPVAVRIRFLSVGGAAEVWLAGIQNPEPGTIALFGLGFVAAGTVVIRRRRRSKKL